MRIEIFEGEDDPPVLVGDFESVPRVGEYLSNDVDGYFRYYRVVEIWYRQIGKDPRYQACLLVTVED